MASRRFSKLLAAAALVGLSGFACFDPKISPGKACGPGGECPGDLVCDTVTNTCQLPGGADGGDLPDGAADAAPDAFNPAGAAELFAPTSGGGRAGTTTNPDRARTAVTIGQPAVGNATGTHSIELGIMPSAKVE
jgi:hypothetical protein